MMNVPNLVGRTLLPLVALAAVHVAAQPLLAQDHPHRPPQKRDQATSSPIPDASIERSVESTLKTNHPPSDGRDGITATFSIVAVDPATGMCGAAVASKYPAVGKVVPIAVGGVGAFCTQHYHVPKWRQQAIELLREKVRPEEVLVRLLKDDPQPEQRQLGIIDALGRTAVHNPTQAPADSRYWGAMTGRDYCCQGNTLAGREVIVEMARAFEETRGTLADRLMAALAAGDRVGGDHRGRLAAGIRVAKPGIDGDWLALDVDKSEDAVEELVLRYNDLRHEAKGTGAIPPRAKRGG